MVRLAPTPSGYLHFGNCCNFALNALLGERYGLPLLLRIDDLDRGRYRRSYVEDIFRAIDLLGIRPDRGPSGVGDFEKNWSQLTRMDLYREALETARASGDLYACPCSRRQIQEAGHRQDCRLRRVPFDAPNVAWRVDGLRFKSTYVIPDLVREEAFTVPVREVIPDFILRRRDGMPSYQLASVVDDRHFGVSHVGRGADLLPSTAAQMMVAEILGYPELLKWQTFVHHPLLRGAAGEKISKSAGNAAVRELDTRDLRDRATKIAESWLMKSV